MGDSAKNYYHSEPNNKELSKLVKVIIIGDVIVKEDSIFFLLGLR